MCLQSFAAGFCLLFPAFSVFAADSPGAPFAGDRDRILKEQRKRLQDLQQLPGREPPVQPSAPASQGPCFDIRSIRLQGD